MRVESNPASRLLNVCHNRRQIPKSEALLVLGIRGGFGRHDPAMILMIVPSSLHAPALVRPRRSQALNFKPIRSAGSKLSPARREPANPNSSDGRIAGGWQG